MEDKGFVIEDSSRTSRRRQLKTLGNSAISYIVELVTNADDSYRRLETKGLVNQDTVKPIYIEVSESRGSTLISVTDNAEGMSNQRIFELFSGKSYGADNSGGEATTSRGIFGQGATDVMVNSAMDKKQAMLESFKDNEFNKFYFDWDHTTATRILRPKTVKINESQMEEFRSKLKIPFNGTKMTFGVPSSVKFKPKTLIDDLNGIYSLRYILNSKNRKVELTLYNQNHTLSSSKFELSQLPLIKSVKFSLNFDSIEINCHLDLFNNANKQADIDYASHILVVDKNNNVYANTMFGFEKMPKSKSISGILVMDGVYRLAKKYLNKENPEEIFNDDRTGFNTKHEFYKLITSKFLDPIIRESLNQVVSETENLDFSNNKKFKDALSAINKWMSEELKNEIPGGAETGKTAPIDGLSFNRTTITITKGKTYSLRLIINADLIYENDDIFIEAINNTGIIEFTPQVLNYKKEEVKDGNIVIKSITISAIELTNELNFLILRASSKSYSKSISIFVVESELGNAINGMSFEQEEIIFSSNTEHKSKVWFDSEIFPIGTEINFFTEGLNISTNKVILSNEMLVSNTIGCFVVISSGGEIDNSYQITGTIMSNSYSFFQKVIIRNQLLKPQGNRGMITAIKGWVEDGAQFQITFEEKTGTIYINLRNPINIQLMGDLSAINPENPKFNDRQIRYLADLLSFQSALIDIKELERKNQIMINEQDRIEDYINYLNKKKTEIFDRIIKSLI